MDSATTNPKLLETLSELFTKAGEAGLNTEEIQKTARLKQSVQEKNLVKRTSYVRIGILTIVIAVLVSFRLPKTAFKNPGLFVKEKYKDYVYNSEGNCLARHSEYSLEITRKPVGCNMCKGISSIPTFHNMSKDYFLKHHAYTGVPVLVKGGAKNWTALDVFGMDYFKKMYNDEALDEFEDRECQFFGYKTNFGTLAHVLKMSKKRAALKKDQWYIGWSNCVEKVQSKLREHYEKPKFLPDDSETSSLDWIFMGGSGTGAMMHIDGVNRPSWQAMIKGSKTWFLAPAPECLLACPNAYFNATMEQGDILVIDTNIWFHSTFIHPVGLSITIGSEYD